MTAATAAAAVAFASLRMGSRAAAAAPMVTVAADDGKQADEVAFSLRTA